MGFETSPSPEKETFGEYTAAELRADQMLYNRVQIELAMLAYPDSDPTVAQQQWTFGKDRLARKFGDFVGSETNDEVVIDLSSEDARLEFLERLQAEKIS